MGVHEERMKKIQQEENRKKVEANQIAKGEQIMTDNPHINQAQFYLRETIEDPKVKIPNGTVLVAAGLVNPYMDVVSSNNLAPKKSDNDIKKELAGTLSLPQMVIKVNLPNSEFDFKVGDLLYLKSGMSPTRTIDINGVTYHLIENYSIALQINEEVKGEYERFYDSIRRRATQILENFKKESKPESAIYVSNNVIGEA